MSVEVGNVKDEEDTLNLALLWTKFEGDGERAFILEVAGSFKRFHILASESPSAILVSL